MKRIAFIGIVFVAAVGLSGIAAGSAAAVRCAVVKEANTGNREKARCPEPKVEKGEYIKVLPGKAVPGEMGVECAVVAEINKPGNYTNAECTAASKVNKGEGEYIKVLKALPWVICIAGAGTFEFSNDECTEEKADGGFISAEVATTDSARVLIFTLSLKDSGTALGTSEVQCWGGRSEGYVGASGESVVRTVEVQKPETLCKGLKVCESTKVTKVEGVNLPWTEALETGTENMARTAIEGTGGGAGWKIVCNVPIVGSETDECTAKSGEPEEVTFLNEVSSKVLLVLGRFLEARKASCTLGNSTSGSVAGLFAVLLATSCGKSGRLGRFVRPHGWSESPVNERVSDRKGWAC